jgi:hypothetical protein
VKAVAEAAVALRKLRRKVMSANNWSLRDLYRTLELPGDNPLRDAHAELDEAVRAAYGMKAHRGDKPPGSSDDVLAFLLALNHEVAEKEQKGEPVTAPGLPACVKDAKAFITGDCVRTEA